MHTHTDHPEDHSEAEYYTPPPFTDPAEPTASDDETQPIQTLHVGDLVQERRGEHRFAKVTKAYEYLGAVAIRFVFGPEQRELHYFPDELKLIRAAVKPGWERHGLVRNVHRWRMWHVDTGWTAVQPAQCEKPLFRTGFGIGGRTYQRALSELELAILKGKAALDFHEALQ